MIELKIKSA